MNRGRYVYKNADAFHEVKNSYDPGNKRYIAYFDMTFISRLSHRFEITGNSDKNPIEVHEYFPRLGIIQ